MTRNATQPTLAQTSKNSHGRRPSHARRAAPRPTAEPPGAPAGPPTRFTLYDLAGRPRAWYLVEAASLPAPPLRRATRSVAHCILLIDRSSSMRGQLEELKDTLIRLLTLEEYEHENLLVTLLSYAAEGDLRAHFQRESIQDVMTRRSRAQQEIRRMQAGGATCLSQALKMAAELVRRNEPTMIVLHSDGYPNDPSPAEEVRRLAKLASRLQARDVFLNAVAYTGRADFRLLDRLAHALSGMCVRTDSIAELYRALYGSTRLLQGSLLPPREVPLPASFDYQVLVSRAAGRVNGAPGTLLVRGMKPDFDATLYRYRALPQAEYQRLGDVPVRQTDEAVFALARACLAEGNLNTARYALASTFDATLAGQHARALTNPQLAALAEDLDTVLFQPGVLQEHDIGREPPVNRRLPLLEVVRLLQENAEGYEVNLRHLLETYTPRGVKRIPGTRDARGRLTEPWLRTRYTETIEYIRPAAFDLNRTSATLNMLIRRPVQLVRADNGRPIHEVAGIPLDRLSDFHNYTLVSDGEVNVPRLRLRIYQQELYDRLREGGALEYGDGPAPAVCEPAAEYTLRLDLLPLVPPFETRPDLDRIFVELAELKVLGSLVAACLDGEGTPYSAEQLEALKRHYLSKNLYVNLPTTTPYYDLQRALAEGSVDSRTSYQIELGARGLLGLGKLMSANQFLQRWYEVTGQSGARIAKPTLDAYPGSRWQITHKGLSPRLRVTPADVFMARLFDDFFGLGNHGAASTVLSRVGAAQLATLVQARQEGREPHRAAFIEALAEAQSHIDACAEQIYRDELAPLVFYVGATGLLPDELQARALSAAELKAKYPDLNLSKSERDGTFFEVGDALLSVYATRAYFSR